MWIDSLRGQTLLASRRARAPRLLTSVVALLTLSAVVARSDEAANVGRLRVTTQPALAPCSFRGLAMRDEHHVWVSGSDGVVFRTADGGRRWLRVRVDGAEHADFRDIELLPDGSVLLMSVGEGRQSAVYRSRDHGKSWQVVLRNAHPEGFFDGMAFDGVHGWLYGDPVDGRLDVYRTLDGGQHWKRLPESSRPPALDGEVGFAASGTGIAARGHRVWIGTGGAKARVHCSCDNGNSWTAVDSGLRHGKPSAGVFSLDFRDDHHGVAIGGDYLQPNAAENNIAVTTDGGNQWTLPPVKMPHKACVRFLSPQVVLACGRTGIALSTNAGHSWHAISGDSYYTLSYDQTSRVGFLAGNDGRVARFTFNHHTPPVSR